MDKRLLFSARAKLSFTGFCLLSIICFAGFHSFSNEMKMRALLQERDTQHAKDEFIAEIQEKLYDSAILYNRVALDKSLDVLPSLREKLQDLLRQAEPLNRISPGEGDVLKENITYALRELLLKGGPNLKGSFSFIFNVRNHFSLVDKKIDEESARFGQDIDLLINKNPYGSLSFFLACLALILALAVVSVTEIFMPLQKITSRLINAGQYTGDLHGELVEQPGHDELSEAQQALNNLFLHIARDFKSIREANLQAGRRLAAIEATRDGIGIVDSEGNLVYANRALLTLHGIETEEAGQLYTPHGQKMIMDSVMPALFKSGFWQGETPIVRRSGEIRQTEMSLTLLEDGSMVGTARDITRRKTAEREKDELQKLFAQSQKMEAIGRLTGGVAHDFNNLLTIISGNLELLDDIHADDESKGYIAVASRALARGAELTQRLLSFSRKQVLSPRTLNINLFLPEAVTLISRAMGEGVDLLFDMQEDLWLANVDPGQLENALLNLSINARDAMADSGTITISTENSRLSGHESKGEFEVRCGEYVCVSVADTGCGMSPDVVQKAFEPFFTTKRIGKGTGLGLSMVYGFIKQSNGYIFIDSAEGHGTTIRLYFPRALEKIQENISSSIPFSAERAAHETILIAEDERDVLDLSRIMLAKHGYNVMTASNGAQALEILKSGTHIDLLITDIVMQGGMNGRDLAKKARMLHPGLHVLFVSGYASDYLTEISVVPGASFLPKPYTQSKMIQEIHRILNEGNAGTVELKS